MAPSLFITVDGLDRYTQKLGHLFLGFVKFHACLNELLPFHLYPPISLLLIFGNHADFSIMPQKRLQGKRLLQQAVRTSVLCKPEIS